MDKVNNTGDIRILIGESKKGYGFDAWNSAIKVLKKMNIRKITGGTISINKAMIKLLSFTNLSEMMIKTCPAAIQSLCGKNLFIQRRAHTTINLPGKGQAKQWAHYELMSGISPYSFVMWAPLHDLEDEGGVYYIDQKSSSKIIYYIFF